jgi:hypothetical protein
MYIEELTRWVFYDPLVLRVELSCGQCRIWNTYKDEFAKTRLRELSIVD